MICRLDVTTASRRRRPLRLQSAVPCGTPFVSEQLCNYGAEKFRGSGALAASEPTECCHCGNVAIHQYQCCQLGIGCGESACGALGTTRPTKVNIEELAEIADAPWARPCHCEHVQISYGEPASRRLNLRYCCSLRAAKMAALPISS